MFGDASQDIVEPSRRVDFDEVSGLDQRLADGNKLTAAIRDTEQPCIAATRDAARRALGGNIAEAHVATVEEADEHIPALEHIEPGTGQVRAAR